MLVLLSHRHNEPQIGFDQFLLSALAFATAFADLLCQLNLLVHADHWDTTNLYEILVQCLAGAVSNAFLNL